MVLAVLGGVLGMALAAAAIAVWRSFGPASFPRLADVAIDGPLWVFAAAICAGVIVVCGAVPGWLATRDLRGGLESATRTRTGGTREGFVRRTFVVVQVAGAAVLLVCMGLMARGLARLEQVDPGFTPDHALTIQLSLPPTRYANREAIAALYDSLRIRLGAVSGVRAAGAVSLLPLSGLLSTMDIALPDRPAPAPDEVPQAHFRVASPGYFAAAGIGVIDGREFSEHDVLRGKPVAVVSRAFAERHWPGQRVLGRSVQIPQGPQSPLLEIVGVVKDVKQFTIDGSATADLYVPIFQMPVSQASIVAARLYWVIRTEGDPARSILEVRQAVRGVDPDVATSSVRTLDRVLSASLSSRRVNVQLLEGLI